VFAWLIRTARRHIREAGVIGVIIAILLIGAEVMHRIEWLETNYPSIAEILHKVVDVAHIVEAAVVVCAIVILICFLVVKTMRKARLPVSPPSLGVERLLVIPDPPDPQHYRFRMAQHEGDLEPFVQWSDNEMEIAHRHPDLSDDKRRKLYLTWFRLRRESFLVLERFNHGSSRWDALALSIALPLTEHGRDQICRSRRRWRQRQCSDCPTRNAIVVLPDRHMETARRAAAIERQTKSPARRTRDLRHRIGAGAFERVLGWTQRWTVSRRSRQPDCRTVLSSNRFPRLATNRRRRDSAVAFVSVHRRRWPNTPKDNHDRRQCRNHAHVADHRSYAALSSGFVLS
jgi:hypothetical protein